MSSTRALGGGPPCPCGSGAPYAACCEPLHLGARAAATAEELMRSRYAAFAVGHEDYLLRTWHPAHRPAVVDLDPTTVWTGLRILDTLSGGPGDDVGVVEFVASCRAHGQPAEQRERSAFGRRAGRWVYVGPEPQ